MRRSPRCSRFRGGPGHARRGSRLGGGPGHARRGSRLGGGRGRARGCSRFRGGRGRAGGGGRAGEPVVGVIAVGGGRGGRGGGFATWPAAPRICPSRGGGGVGALDEVAVRVGAVGAGAQRRAVGGGGGLARDLVGIAVGDGGLYPVAAGD